MSKTALPIMPMILLSAITIGKTNPRKVFDEDAIAELAESIKSKGVIQPILIRPIGDTLELVCGERRYRASIMAGRTEIPAYIRELTDDEALEAQITENLQRKDVHPMEEAYAFKQMQEKFTVEEIGAKVGKKEYFIRQRLKLNDLTADWQKVFYKNLLPVSDALRIALLPEESQTELLNSQGVDEDNISTFNKEIKIQSWQFNRALGTLSNAPFDITDKEIDKEMGACTGCRFNTAFANLFPEDAVNPKCTKVSCFAKKCDINFEKQVSIAIEDLTVTLISDSYQPEKKLLEKYKKVGRDVLSSGQYNDITDSYERPDWEEFKDNNEDDYDSEEELKAAFDKEVAEYEAEQLSVKNKIDSGKYIRAFYVDGNERGKYSYIELNKKTAKPVASKDPANPSVAAIAEIDFEIEKIKERQKRAKELDGEKVHVRIVEAIQTGKELKKMPAEFTAVDRVLMLYILCEYGGHSIKDDVKKALGLNVSYDMPKGDKFYEQLENITDEQMSFLVRAITFSKYKNILPQNTSGFMVRKLAENIGTIPIEAYETEQKEKAATRLKNADKRIAELQTQKKELQAQVKPAAEKPVKKTAAKKK